MSSPSIPDLLAEDDEAIDKALIAMNEATMRMLDAEIDEVAEISSRKSPRSLSPQSFAGNEKDKVHLESMTSVNSNERNVSGDLEPSYISEKRSATTLFDDDDDDDDDDDASFLEELSALRRVSKQIEEELRKENEESMDLAVQKIINSPAASHKSVLLQSTDERIINNILLHKGVPKSMPESRIEELVNIINDRLDAKETTRLLSIACVAVWSLAFGLMRNVMYAEL